MKTSFLKKLLISFSAFVIVASVYVYACADSGDWGVVYETNYTPEAFTDETYAPLFLSNDLFYNSDPLTDNVNRFNDEILADWKTYMGTTLKEDDLNYFIFGKSTKEVEQLYQWTIKKKENAVSKKWAKKINLNDSKIKNFIEFIYLAQQIEAVSTDVDSWDYQPETRKVITNDKFLKFLEARYKNNKDNFLKNRYWFLTVKAYFYSSAQQQALPFFKATEASVKKNTLYYRALSYVAGINYRAKNFAISNYQFSVVFDQCKALQIVAAYNFHPQEEKDWNESLAMANKSSEKAALWAIQGYYNDEVKAIQNIYQLQPNSPHLEFLLSRLVNKEEVLNNQLTEGKSFLERRSIAKDSLDKEALKLVEQIAKEGKTTKPYMWQVAAGYLQTMNGNYQQAQTYYDLAEKGQPNTSLVAKQMRLLRFVNNLSSMDQINEENAGLLLKDLKWLHFELNDSNETVFRWNNASIWSKKYLSALYKYRGNEVMAEMFDRKAGFYSNENNLAAMKAFLANPNKSEIEKIAQQNYDVSLGDIYEYQSVMATFKNNSTEAITYMQQAEGNKDLVFDANPFNGNIKDCHDCDFAAFQKRKYTQLQFLQIIKEMQDKLSKKEDPYNNNLLLANAFYNITFFGNGRSFYSGNIIDYEGDYTETDPYESMITNCSLAKSYYEKAFQAAENDEQRAKCQYMLAKCERNQYYTNKFENITSSWLYDRDKVNFLAWGGFKALKNDYSKTKYYQEVIKECGYFDVYINGPKKE
ncbi:hypothetical protein OX284_001065 [Flavobacterium sp. SUN046]|uniref:hypothetical protein n=1 Tax=Flavobacterium sp. SUN046 TaxID=3002440 RepID=UPI002DBE5D77|nr:hypothetical protein [Flavobacterium sp. SUN046]MEC4048003.1 hypothetical protein [Flavobacterium sp. SUN046]